MSAGVVSLGSRLERIQRLALFVGGVALAVSLVLAFVMPATVLPPYLVAFIFWFGIGLGSLGLMLLNNLVDGSWAKLIRRPLEAGSMTLVPIALLFLPLLIGLSQLYPWAGPEAESDPLIVAKAPYLNGVAFTIRAVLYFATWIGLAVVLRRGAARRDEEGGNDRPSSFLQAISGPGLLFLFLTATFAAVDWTMSLEPHWYSSLYGPMLIVGWGLATFATMILVTSRLADAPAVARATTVDRWHDLGNLMLAFTMLWAYMSFAQYLIIYSGNLLEEIPWYIRRTRGGWQFVAIALILFQFFLPFFLLLSRESKRRAQSLRRIAALVLVMQLVNTVWLIIPAHGALENPQIPWLQVLLVPLTVTAVGGVCIATFLWFLNSKSLDSLSPAVATSTPGHS